jgi:hypothetical protein
MGIRTLETIRGYIKEDWTTFTEDSVYQLADDLVPVYYDQIIEEWLQLPMDHQDTWQDTEVSEDTAITQLMAIDLFNYYLKAVEQAYYDLKREQE